MPPHRKAVFCYTDFFMTRIIIESDFKTLREAYLNIKAFVAKEVGEDEILIKSKIVDDLGCAGDDNWELIQKFIAKYNLDNTGFEYSKHFLSEGELFDSFAALLRIISLPFAILFWLLKTITFGKLDLNKVKIFPDWQREVVDMTFGDLLSWYLAGRYCLRDQISIRIKKAV